MKTRTLTRMFQVAILATMFGAASVQAQQTEKSGSAATSSAAKSEKGGGTVSKQDQKMMRDMAHSNLAEIETGKLALSKTQDEKVKAFAQKMIDDHTKAQQDLQKVAEAKGVTLPTQPDTKHQKMAKKLSALSGEEFDRLYLQQGGVADHKRTHRLLGKAQSSAKDPELKALAEKTEPIVEEHLTMAQQLHGDKGGAKKATSTSANRATTAPATSGGAAPGSSSGGSAK